jgi:hypothetical protein
MICNCCDYAASLRICQNGIFLSRRGPVPYYECEFLRLGELKKRIELPPMVKGGIDPINGGGGAFRHENMTRPMFYPMKLTIINVENLIIDGEPTPFVLIDKPTGGEVDKEGFVEFNIPPMISPERTLFFQSCVLFQRFSLTFIGCLYDTGRLSLSRNSRTCVTMVDIPYFDVSWDQHSKTPNLVTQFLRELREEGEGSKRRKGNLLLWQLVTGI